MRSINNHFVCGWAKPWWQPYCRSIGNDTEFFKHILSVTNIPYQYMQVSYKLLGDKTSSIDRELQKWKFLTIIKQELISNRRDDSKNCNVLKNLLADFSKSYGSKTVWPLHNLSYHQSYLFRNFPVKWKTSSLMRIDAYV